MTPLAHRLARELTLPKNRRTFVDDTATPDYADLPRRAPLLPEGMSDLHCFEVTAIDGLIESLMDVLVQGTPVEDYLHRPHLQEPLAFLPADKAWIEWREPWGHAALHIVDLHKNGDRHFGFARIILALDNFFGAARAVLLPLHGDCGFGRCQLLAPRPGISLDYCMAWYFRAYAALAIINSPKIVGRHEHTPHRGLERQLAHTFRGSKFQLNPWTEIKLEVTPHLAAGDSSEEARLTGQRALHFCRAHLRIRLGKLEIVRSHWRGDPSLGIRRSDYAVTP